MVYFVLALSLGVNVVNAALGNAFSKHRAKGYIDHILFSIATSLLAMVCLLLVAGSLQAVSFFTVGLGTVFGLLSSLSFVSHSIALTSGPLSYTVLIMSSSMLLPTFSGALFWGEKLAWVQVASIFLLLVSFYLGIEVEKEGSFTKLWGVMVTLSFLGNGLVGVVQKIHQTSPHKTEISEFLIISFFVSVLVLLVVFAFLYRKGERPTAYQPPRSYPLLITIFSGIGLAFVHQVNLYLTGVLPTIFFFPVYNGLRIPLTAVIDRIFFKEKLTKRQTVGMIIGVVAILLLSGVLELLGIQ